MTAKSSILDLTRGRYRRQYDGFLNGRRINAVSRLAEWWFWRLHAIADDFGNFLCDPIHLRNTAAPRRDITPSEADALTKECSTGNLIEMYEAKGEPYGHVVGFLVLQPPPRNGRRVRRYPAFPGEQSELDQIIAEPQFDQEGVPGNPGESGGYNHHQQQQANQYQHEHHNHHQQGAAAESAAPVSLAAAARSPADTAVVYSILRRFWKDGTVDTLAAHRNASAERVAWLADRVAREKVRRGQGFIRKGLDEGWEIPAEWLARWRRSLGGAA